MPRRFSRNAVLASARAHLMLEQLGDGIASLDLDAVARDGSHVTIHAAASLLAAHALLFGAIVGSLPAEPASAMSYASSNGAVRGRRVP